MGGWNGLFGAVFDVEEYSGDGAEEYYFDIGHVVAALDVGEWAWVGIPDSFQQQPCDTTLATVTKSSVGSEKVPIQLLLQIHSIKLQNNLRVDFERNNRPGIENTTWNACYPSIL